MMEERLAALEAELRAIKNLPAIREQLNAVAKEAQKLQEAADKARAKAEKKDEEDDEPEKRRR